MTITDEMIEAAARAMFDVAYPVKDWEDQRSRHSSVACREYARAALTAVAPLIARQVRAETVEECAKVALTKDVICSSTRALNVSAATRTQIAAAIRALTNEASHDGV